MKLYLRIALPFKAEELDLKYESCKNTGMVKVRTNVAHCYISGAGIFLSSVAQSSLLADGRHCSFYVPDFSQVKHIFQKETLVWHLALVM